MRINIYSQELTKEVALVDTIARDTGIKHYGVRLFLHSPSQLHNRPGDDDRSAITLWVPEANSFTADDLMDVIARMYRKAWDAKQAIRARR